MAIVFAARGDSLDARYSNGGKTGTRTSSTLVVHNTATAGALGGVAIDFNTVASSKALTWNAALNSPNGRTLSVNHGYIPQYSGAPSSRRAIINLSANSGRLGQIELTHETTSGNINVTAINAAGTVCINGVSAGAFSPTSGTRYDIAFSWDGTTTANSFKVYVDGASLGNITPSAAFETGWTNTYFKEIILGVSRAASAALHRTDELVIWDTIIDFTANVALESGNGLLNGASRTSYVSVSALDGQSWTTLAGDKIKTGESQTQAGVAVSGTYTGSDRWSDPGESNVALGVGYKADSTTNNKTGSLVASSGTSQKFIQTGDF